MSEYARVLDVHEMAAFRALLVKVAEVVRNGVAAGDGEVRDMKRWLAQEQPLVWARRIKQLQRKLDDAKEAFRRKQSTPTPTGEPPNTMFEKKQVRLAKERLEEAQARAAKTKLWANRFDREEHAFHGGTQGARTASQHTLPQAAHTLDELLGHLEDYIRLRSNITTPHDDTDRRDDHAETMTRPADAAEPDEQAAKPDAAEEDPA